MMTAKVKGLVRDESGVIGVNLTAPNMKTAIFVIRGTAPYVHNAFSARAQQKMAATQKAGGQARSRKERAPKDFERDCKDATHFSLEGWEGIPATSFRNAMISACRLVSFKMTLAKMSVFVVADGYDRTDGTPLIKVTKGKPSMIVSPVRNSDGSTDLRARPQWKPGWEATVRVEYDNDQFSAEDVANLLMRVGRQVGIGSGRPDSRMSNGLGWGTFEITNRKDERVNHASTKQRCVAKNKRETKTN